MHFKSSLSENKSSALDLEAAQLIAVEALHYLAAEPDLLGRFMAISGIAQEQMRDAAKEQGFLVGVLDFFLAHEPSLIAFADAKEISPETVVNARHALDPSGYDYA